MSSMSLNTSNVAMNRNSNIKKVIRGGNGSVYNKNRSSTYVPGNVVQNMSAVGLGGLGTSTDSMRPEN